MPAPNILQSSVSPYVLQSPKHFLKMQRVLRASRGGVESRDPSGLVLAAHQDLEKSIRQKVSKQPLKQLNKASKG